MFEKINSVSINDEKTLNFLFYNIQFLHNEYPEFTTWVNQKVVPGLYDGSRKIFIVKSIFDSNTIRGVLILKDTEIEKKICTLYVDKESRNNGIGRKLFNLAFEELKTEKPLITIADDKVASFEKLLKQYDFKLFQNKLNFYRKGHSEYSYNGVLSPEMRIVSA